MRGYESHDGCQEAGSTRPLAALLLSVLLTFTLSVSAGCAPQQESSPAEGVSAEQAAGPSAETQEEDSEAADAQSAKASAEPRDQAKAAEQAKAEPSKQASEEEQDKDQAKAQEKPRGKAAKAQDAQAKPSSPSKEDGKAKSSGKSAAQDKKPAASSESTLKEPASAAEAEAAPQPESQEITVQVWVDASHAADAGYEATFANQSCTLPAGSSAFDALKATGLSYRGNGSYVSAINGLAEKQLSATSGWMYAVNGTAPNKPCGSYTLSDGDSVRWYYVTSYSDR